MRNLKNAAIINIISKYSVIIINLIFTAILARLLKPDDYGIVAVVMVFTTFFSLLSDMGLGSGVIQNKQLTDDDIDSIYSFTVYFGVFLSVFFIFFSFVIASFYKNYIYIRICSILSISVFFNTLNMIPNALILKNKRFVLNGFRNFVVNVITNSVIVILAILKMKYYSIVIGTTLSSIIIYLWNIITTNIKFRLRIDFNSIRKIMGFSIYQFLFNFINYFARNLDNLLTGKYIGEVSLGYYDKAYKLMVYPVQNITHAITPVMHPILSDLQNNKMTIYIQYIRIVKILSTIGVFVMLVCFYSSKEIILIMFGSNWIASASCFKYLSISVWAQMITSTTGVAFQSLGDTKTLFKVGLINSIVSIVAIISGISTKSIEKLAIMVAVAYLVHFFIAYLLLIRRSFKKKFIEFLFIFKNDAVIFCVIIFFESIFKIKIDNIIISFVYKAIIIFVGYIVGLVITKEYKIFLEIIRSKE